MAASSQNGISRFISCLYCVANLDPGCPTYHQWAGHFGVGGRWHCGRHRRVLSDLRRQHTFHDLGKRTEVDTGKQVATG